MVRPASSSVRVTESRGVRARGSRGPPRPGGRGQSSVPAEFLRERDAMAEQHTTLGVTAMDRGRAGRESPPLTGPAQGYRMRVCLRDVPPPLHTHTPQPGHALHARAELHLPKPFQSPHSASAPFLNRFWNLLQPNPAPRLKSIIH